MTSETPIAEALNEAANNINTTGIKTETSTSIKNKTTPIAQTAKAPVKRVVTKKKNLTDYDHFRIYVNNAKLAIKKPDGGLYLMAEAWLYLAHLKGVMPSVTTEQQYDNSTGDVIRVIATCKLLKESDGTEVSRATMMAEKKEKFLKDKDNYAVVGMAETRAISRCIRNVYGYVAKAAGFESTPAIEMGLEGYTD